MFTTNICPFTYNLVLIYIIIIDNWWQIVMCIFIYNIWLLLINTFTGSNKASEKDYSILRIENGIPIYKLNLDRSSLNSLLTLKSTSINKINDGKWHTIEIWKNGQVCKLKNGYFFVFGFYWFCNHFKYKFYFNYR